MKIKSIIFLFIIAFPSNAQGLDTLQVNKPKSFPSWTLFVPGATYYYNGRIVEGLTFSAIEIGGIVMGLHYDNTLKSNSTSPYYNYPLFIGLKTLDVDKCDWVRNKLELIKYFHPDFKYDPISEQELFLAPFKAENVFTVVTLGLVGVAFVELWLDGRGVEKRIDKVQQMYFLDRYIDRNPALAIYSTTSLAMSWGAGISEEYYFRNGLMPVLDYEYGQTNGLIFSSVTFGVLHLSNLLFSNKPDYGQALAQVIEATLTSLVLGQDVHNRGYKIGPAVAAHAWYDFTLMLGSFLINPKENVFAVKVNFNIQ
jgi:membrane protease YdiL (CAAX protease family)